MNFPDVLARAKEKYGTDAQVYFNGTKAWASTPDGRYWAGKTLGQLAVKMELTGTRATNSNSEEPAKRQRFVSASSVARELRLSPSAIWVYAHKRGMPHHPENGFQRQFLLSECREWFEQYKAEHSASPGRPGMPKNRPRRGKPNQNATPSQNATKYRDRHGLEQLHCDIEASLRARLQKELAAEAGKPWSPTLGQLVSHYLKKGMGI